MKKILAVLGLGTGLLGCAQLSTGFRAYVEPTEGQTAKVRFVTNGRLQLLPGRSCKDWSAPGAGALIGTSGSSPFGGRKIGVKGEAPKDFVSGEVLVTAGRPVTVVFDSLFVGTASCEYSWAFVPKAGDEYEVRVWHEVSTNGGMCRFEPRSLTNPMQRLQIELAKDC